MKKICIICEKEYPCNEEGKNSRSGARGKSKRPRKSLTCSRKCSKTFSRVSRRVSNTYYAEIKKLENQIKKIRKQLEKNDK